MLKKLLIASVVIISFVLLYNLGKQIYDSLDAGKRVDEEVAKLSQLQKKNALLKKELADVNSVSFLESQARNKFNMSRPGESVVIIPQEDIDRVLSAEKKVPDVQLPNWQGWMKLFINPKS